MTAELFTIAEAAAYTRMSQSWWRQRIFRQEIRFVRIGRRVLIPRSTLEEVQQSFEPRARSKYCNDTGEKSKR